jgi:tetratricopeptide (TPR) repeat protein
MSEPFERNEADGGRSRWRRPLGWAAVLAVAAGATWALAHYGFGRQREWTTSSDEALSAFRDGLEGSMRFYEVEAAASFRRAIEIDPGFAAARYQLARVSRDGAERKRLIEELGAADLSRLTPRERFLIETALSYRDPARQREITARALGEQPEDPWVLFLAAQQAWDREEWRESEELYRRLLAVDPNWVTAHNHLGYLSMSQSRFAESEEHFRTYAFVAPDQANPHDSLGELLSLLGRYDEAKSELELALAEKPDFCASYVNLVGIAFSHGDGGGGEAILERARGHCPEEWQKMLDCEIRLHGALFERDYDRPWREGFAGCAGEPGKRGPLLHRLALLAGRPDEALAEEAALEKELADTESDRYKGRRRMLELRLHHERGVRALVDGHLDEAVRELSEADAQAFYWGASEGRFKLFNLANLALALDRANDRAGSERALAAMRAVNPAFAALYPRMVADLAER